MQFVILLCRIAAVCSLIGTGSCTGSTPGPRRVMC